MGQECESALNPVEWLGGLFLVRKRSMRRGDSEHRPKRAVVMAAGLLRRFKEPTSSLIYLVLRGIGREETVSRYLGRRTLPTRFSLLSSLLRSAPVLNRSFYQRDFYIPLDRPTPISTRTKMAPIALSVSAATATPTVTKASSDFDPGHVQVGAKSMNFPAPPTFDDPKEERRFKLERLAGAFRIFGKLGYDEGVSIDNPVAETSQADFVWLNRSAVTSVGAYHWPKPCPRSLFFPCAALRDPIMKDCFWVSATYPSPSLKRPLRPSANSSSFPKGQSSRPSVFPRLRERPSPHQPRRRHSRGRQA